MANVPTDELVKFIEPRITQFHTRRLETLQTLKLNKILARKNPYLFKAKNQNTASDLIKTILDAHLSSQEEGIFGGFLEELAVFICGIAHGGRKSTAEGIDLEFTEDNTTYLVYIKSGPNWGNAGQISKMKDNFIKAKRILRTNAPKKNVICVEGCCYSKDEKWDKGEHWKLCGQRFWEFISGSETLYIDIIEPLGHKAKQKNEQFQTEYEKTVNRFTLEFSQEYCSKNGAIMWEELVRFNSGKAPDRTPIDF